MRFVFYQLNPCDALLFQNESGIPFRKLHAFNFSILYFTSLIVESFKFDHTSYLSLSELQLVSIRSTQWLEESFGDPYGRIIEITYPADELPVFVSLGFCEIMLPILYIFELDIKAEEATLRSRQARILTREEVKNVYCSK